MSDEINESLIFGVDKTERIVSVEAVNDKLIIFKEELDGKVTETSIPNDFWFITHDVLSSKQMELEGKQFYKYLATFPTFQEKEDAKRKVLKSGYDKEKIYGIYDKKEQSLIRQGMTYFKGMKSPKEVSVLSFDIETDGLNKTQDSTVYIITNTYRKLDKVIKKTFTLDKFKSQADMLNAWCKWVREVNPSLMIGHNIYMYDLSYLQHVATLNDIELKLGRDNSPITFSNYVSKFRKDGSQEYDYNKCYIFGREIVDTFFTSVQYDIARNFESYGLKSIVRQLGMEKADRSFIDAGKIRKYFENRHEDPEMWDKTVSYAEEDSDDSLKLFDLMIPAKFLLTQSVSKSFQEMCTSATGSQINNMMVRAYLQDGHSIAKADLPIPFQGAISVGFPGFYNNVVRWDAAGLYPSIMRQYKLYNKQKDPKKYFIYMVEYFTLERFKNKELAKKTGEQYYKDLEQTMKIGVNSMYGFLGAKGLSYNYPEGAAFVTRKGRELLERMIYWASGKTLEELNPKPEIDEVLNEE